MENPEQAGRTEGKNVTDSPNGKYIVISQQGLEQTKLKQEEIYLINMNTFFPEETWAMVLEKLNDRTNIENCTNASPFFRSLLRYKREIEVVLPKVFGILANCYSTKENTDESFKETNIESIPWNRPDANKVPHRMSGIWKCRLVCKTWNNVIEQLHQNEDAGHFDMAKSFKSTKNAILGSQWGTEDLYTESKLERFMDHFKVTHFDVIGKKPKKCPFLGRSLLMETGFDVRQLNVYFGNMLELVGKWGREIWYFQFIYHDGNFDVNFVGMYTYLQILILLMPNLKALGITFLYANDDQFLSRKGIKDLRAAITIHPFPTLAKLKYLLAYGIPATLFNHVSVQNQHIQQLCVSHQKFQKTGKIFSKVLTNLTQLSLDICSKTDFERFESSAIYLNANKFRLKYYSIDDTYSDDDDSDSEENTSVPFVHWARVFATLEKKLDGGVCTELSLQLPTPYTVAEQKSVLEDSVSYRLEFPAVQHIKIRATTVFSLDFLLPLKQSLREITFVGDFAKFWKGISSVWSDRYCEMQVVKFLGLEDNIRDSNISIVFPLLKTLTILNTRENVRYDFDQGTVKKNILKAH